MKKLNINIPVRLKNPMFWIGLLGVILAAMGINPEMLTSWQAVSEAFKNLVSNPYMIVCVVVAVVGVFNDPTTKGIKDSDRVMSRNKPV